MSCIVITIHHSASIEVGRGFKYWHTVGISDEDGIKSQIQLFGEFIGPPRDENLRVSSGYFFVVAIATVSVVVDGGLQVLRIICVAIPDRIVRLCVPVDRIGGVIRKKRSVASGNSGVILLI